MLNVKCLIFEAQNSTIPTVANILNYGEKHRTGIKVVKCLCGMYHININVGNFAPGKLKQRVEFSLRLPYCQPKGMAYAITTY